jgi:hypothetical protein
MLRLAIVRGGMSLGAFESVSAKGLISFGSVTVTSSLHQETYAGSERADGFNSNDVPLCIRHEGSLSGANKVP